MMSTDLDPKIAELMVLRDRMMPMFAEVSREFEERGPAGYPTILDAPARGAIGLELDPNFGLYIIAGADGLQSSLYWRASRTEARSSASREKFSGAPNDVRRPISAAATDQELRNLIAELISRQTGQPLLIHITDT